MRPYVVKGHTRPLTYITYNREGDLLISCAKDEYVCLWYEKDGTRLGTFNGHKGAVFNADITWDSSQLITSSFDSTVRLWDVKSGEELFCWDINVPCRACSFSIGDRFAAFSTDMFMETLPSMRIISLEEDMSNQTSEVLMLINPSSQINRMKWVDFNKSIITAHDDGFVRCWDIETGDMTKEYSIHEGSIRDMKFSSDGTHFITASIDKTAKLIDSKSFQVLKIYKAGRPVNTADISPTYDHIVLGGGQEAREVTHTASEAGRFEASFFHKIYAEEFGCVRGHFGPINTIAFHPSGQGFTSGGEEGYVRIHHFDDDYFTTKYF